MKYNNANSLEQSKAALCVKNQGCKLIDAVEKSVVMALDRTDSNLFPYLPYIMQDLWELGASPEVVLKLVKKHMTDHSDLKVLDLGCGKGAVLIKLAKEFDAEEHCCFECDDIRIRISDLRDCDIVILGAIGPVIGDYYSTLTKLSKCIKEGGRIIIDDAYTDDGGAYSHPLVERKSVILEQISNAGMKLIDEIIINKDEIEKSNEYMYKNIKRRCQELIEIHPDKKNFFVNYIGKQEEENEALETKMVCSTMLIGK